MAFEKRTQEIQEDWRRRLGGVRANSAVDLLVRALPGAPLLTAGGAAKLIGRSFQAANLAIERLEEAGIVTQISLGRRNRAFEARDAVDAFTDLERQLASPEGNTLISTPSRRVPPRRPN
jgi:hypothetical protein